MCVHITKTCGNNCQPIHSRIMYYNPDTEKAIRSLDDLAAETRRVISKLNPPKANDIVWSVSEGRWVKNTTVAA